MDKKRAKKQFSKNLDKQESVVSRLLFAVEEISGFSYHEFANTNRLNRKKVGVVSKVLTGPQAAEILSQSIGKKIKYFQAPMENIKPMGKGAPKMLEWFARAGFSIDKTAYQSKSSTIGLHIYESLVKSQNIAFS